MRQHDLVLDRDGDGAQRAAQRQRAGIAHEDHGGRGVVPEKAQTGADQRGQEHRQLAGACDIGNLQIVGEPLIADQIGDQDEGRGGDHHRHDGEAIETVGEVHGIGGAGDDEAADHDEEQAQRDQRRLDEGNGQHAGQSPASSSCMISQVASDGDAELDHQARAAADSPSEVRLVTL